MYCKTTILTIYFLKQTMLYPNLFRINIVKNLVLLSASYRLILLNFVHNLLAFAQCVIRHRHQLIMYIDTAYM